MLAKVKPESRFKTIIAFSGHEYTQREWRKVPRGYEAEAKRNSFLVLKEDSPEKEQRIAEARPTKPGLAQTVEQVSSGYAEPVQREVTPPSPAVVIGDEEDEGESESDAAEGEEPTEEVKQPVRRRGGRRKRSE